MNGRLTRPNTVSSVGPMTHRTRGVLAAALLAVAAFTLASCASGTSGAEGSPTSPATSAAGTASLQTLTPGVLTIATGQPAYSPWVEDNDPQSGKGFEAAVAYAVANQLGYPKNKVRWVRTTFDQAIAPGAKNFDFNLQQFSITPQRKKAVDFSSPYYTTSQAVVARKSSDAAKATSVADLKGALIGVAAGSTSLQAAQKIIAPTQQLKIFNSNDDAVAALKSGGVDALVLDLPTAFYVANAQIDDGVVVGQLPGSTSGGDQFGLLLAKNSPLTAPVTQAVNQLRANGTLVKLQQQWLADQANAPVLAK